MTSPTTIAGAFEHHARVRFHQADPAGVLFFGRVFELVSDAYEEMIRAAGLSFDDPDSLGRVTTPIVRVETDYRRAMRVGDDVTVRLALERLGESSFSYAFEIVDRAGVVRAAGRVVHTFVSLPGFETIAIPPRARTALEDLARRYGMALQAGSTGSRTSI